MILNVCDCVNAVTEPIAPLTVGMEETLDDEAAINFSRGFYQALASGREPTDAVEEGRIAAALEGNADGLPIVVLSDPPA